MENFDVFKLDGRSLRVFLSVCDTGSVSQTAANFDLNQSTISHTLDKLRSAIGDHLFVKSGRGITPTEKALSIVPKVQKILAELEGLVETDVYDPSLEQRPLSIAISSPSFVTEMQSVIAKAALQAPNVRFHIKRLAPRERLEGMLVSGEADVAIAVSEARYPAILNNTRCCDDELVIFYDPASRGPINTVAEYAAARHAVAGFGGATKSVVEVALEAAGVKRDIAMVSPTASMLGNLILGTDLVATMPKKNSRPVYEKLAYCIPPIELPTVHYDLVWHRRYEFSGRNMWLRDLLMNSAPGA